jgi:hypothetical protein
MGERPAFSDRKSEAKASGWFAHIEQWKASGISQVEFCRTRKLSIHSFRWWKWKLSKRAEGGEGSGLLVEWQPTSGDSAPSVSVVEGNRWMVNSGVEIWIRGVRVRLSVGFDEKAFASALRVIEAR